LTLKLPPTPRSGDGPSRASSKTPRERTILLRPGADFHSDGVPFPDLLTHVTRVKKGIQPAKGMAKLAFLTVHDQPDSKMLQQTKVLDTLGSKVVNMSSAFEEVTNMKAEKHTMMNQMHAHSMDKVEETRVHMEKLLTDIGSQIGDFTVEWDQKRLAQLDDLDYEMRERVRGLQARYTRLEERALRLNNAIEEETVSRISDTEALMLPVNKTVERLTADLAREREIRENRERELMQHFEESVKMLEARAATEGRQNRVDRHAEAVNEYVVEYQRLQRRHGQIGEKSNRLITVVQTDFDADAKLRVEGQDHITQRINDFMKRFQMHVLEEGDVGN